MPSMAADLLRRCGAARRERSCSRTACLRGAAAAAPRRQTALVLGLIAAALGLCADAGIDEAEIATTAEFLEPVPAPRRLAEAAQPLQWESLEAEAAPRRELSPWRPIPQTGAHRLLVIQAEFSDDACEFTGEQQRERFFGAEGFAEYFRANSFNELRYSGEVIGMTDSGEITRNSPNKDCVKLPENVNFYAGDQYGFGVTRCSRRSNSGLVLDALSVLDKAGFDFSPYADENGEMHNVVVLAPSRSFHIVQDASASLLSTAYELKFVFYNCLNQEGETLPVTQAGFFESTSGITSSLFTFCTSHTWDTERMAALGVCIHEHGHALGMFDQYGVGQYSLMGVGLWGPDTTGSFPSHLSAYDKMHFGWIVPTGVPPGTEWVEYTLRASHKNRDALKLQMRDSPEYFLVENRQELGWLSPKAAGKAPNFCQGILIWHIDPVVANVSGKYWKNNAVNNLGAGDPPPHRGIIVKEADADDSLPGVHHECNDTLRAENGIWGGKDALLWDGSQSSIELQVMSSPDALGSVNVRVKCPRCVLDGTTLAPTVWTPAPTPTPTPAPTPKPGSGQDDDGTIVGAYSCDDVPAAFSEYCDGSALKEAQSSSFDCFDGTLDWRTKWSVEKTTYCCSEWSRLCKDNRANSAGIPDKAESLAVVGLSSLLLASLLSSASVAALAQ